MPTAITENQSPPPTCPKCETPITNWHPYGRCSRCKEPFSDAVDAWFGYGPLSANKGQAPEIAASATGQMEGATGISSGNSAESASPQRLPFCYGPVGLPFLWLMFHGRPFLGLWVGGLSLWGLPAITIATRAFAEGRRVNLTSLEVGVLCLLLAAGWVVRVYLGEAGSTVAWNHRGYTTVEELVAGESTWNALGGAFALLDGLLSAFAVLILLTG